MWLEVWDNSHTLNARWLAYGLHILAREFESFQSNGSHKHCAHFLDEFDWSKVFHGGIKHGIFSCIPSFKCNNPKIPTVIHAHFPPRKRSSPIFWDPMDKAHFDLKTCAWKVHNQYRVKCTQKDPFIGLGSQGLKGLPPHIPLELCLYKTHLVKKLGT